MTELRVGHIGGGGRTGLVESALAHNARITAVADLDDKVLETFKEKYEGIFTTNNYRDILNRDDVDVVFITTPDFLHEEMAIAALEAGKAVYLEKPMAITIEGCDRILETARKTGSKLYLGHNMRHFPVILKMKELIDSGIIGEVQTVWCRHFIAYGADAYFKDWHSEQKYANSLLLQKGAHDIDVIHWLANGYTKSVTGMGKLSVYDKCERRKESDKPDTSWSKENWPPLEQKGLSPVIDVEDNNMIMMQLDNGVQVSYNQCHYTPDSSRNYTFIGTHGRIENIGDHGECKVLVYTSRRSDFHRPDMEVQLFPIEGGHGGSDPAIVGEFLRFVREGGETNTNPIAGRNAVAAGVMGAVSMRNGSSAQVIPQLDPELTAYFENGQVAEALT